MEHGHRVLGLFVTIFFAFLAKERLTFYKGIHKLIPIICSILLAIQIVAGALVVILQLETNITTFHFGNAMVIFILIYTMCLYKNSEELNSISIFTKKNIPYLFLFLLVYLVNPAFNLSESVVVDFFAGWFFPVILYSTSFYGFQDAVNHQLET